MALDIGGWVLAFMFGTAAVSMVVNFERGISLPSPPPLYGGGA